MNVLFVLSLVLASAMLVQGVDPSTYNRHGSSKPIRKPLAPYVPTYYHAQHIPNKPLNALDKINARIEAAVTQLKIANEKFNSLVARSSVQAKFLQKAELAIKEFIITDEIQNDLISKLFNHLGRVKNDTLDLAYNLKQLRNQVEENGGDLEALENQVAATRRNITTEISLVTLLVNYVHRLPATLLQQLTNAFWLLLNTVKEGALDLGSNKGLEHTRVCEVLAVTLDADDRRAELLFQSKFPYPPQTLVGIAGFRTNLNARNSLPVNPYAYPPLPPNPASVGFNLFSYTTSTGVTVEKLERSFGDVATMTVDVQVEACSVGPRHLEYLPETSGAIFTTTPVP